MKKRQIFTLLPLLIFILVGVMACQPEVVEVTKIVTEAQEVVVTQVVEVEGEVVVMEVVVEATPGVTAAATGAPANVTGDIASNDPTQLQAQQRLIIKDGRMSLMVTNTDAAAQEAINLITELGGYVINQRIWDGERGYRFATLQVAVPVAEFGNAMFAFRTLGTVTDESATGEDVTDEYVDLNSHLGNLYATQEQLRVFLEQATNITETLTVYAELVKVEQEINAIQGRINYLADRSAFSTINLDINPFIPTPTPTATATPTPTPTSTPLPTPDVWRPGDTAQTALVQFQNTAQKTADAGIYGSIVCGPWLVAAALLSLLVWRVVGWGRRRSHKPAVMATVKERNQ